MSVILVYILYSRRIMYRTQIRRQLSSYVPYGTDVTDLRKLENSILHPFQLLLFFFNLLAQTFLNKRQVYSSKTLLQ